MAQIDPQSFVPYYHQLKVILGDLIRQGSLRTDDPLPSEYQLSEEYGVSRATVRKALAGLQQEGLIYSVKGKGSFVAKPKLEQSLFRFYALGRDLKGKGLDFSSRTLQQSEILLPEDVRVRMRREVGARGVLVQRVRLLDYIPLALELSYVCGEAAHAVLTADLASDSLYDVVETATGKSVLKAEEYLEPVVLGAFEAEVLQARVGQPAFHIERLAYIDEARPFEWRQSIIRGDRFRFFTELR